MRMNTLLTYRGRTITDDDVAFLRQLIADQRVLSARLREVEAGGGVDCRSTL